MIVDEKISVNHEVNILCGGLITASMSEFEFMWSKFLSIRDSSRRKILSAIGCIENPSILMRFIMKIIDSDEIIDDEWEVILKSTYSHNHIGLRVTLDFLRSNYDAIIRRL